MSFIFNLFNKPQRTGDVESWDTEINGKWYHQKALVDKKNDNVYLHLSFASSVL
jgi:hypothetical protein